MKKSAYIKGSKIPITFLFEYIENGLTLSDFLSAYPWLKKEDVVSKIKEFKNTEITSRYVF